MNLTCDFSYKHYFQVLDKAKEEYSIGPINNFKKLKTKKKFILLRHDIDYCLDLALDFAKLEKQHNIKSTYFVLLHGTFYNSLSSYNALIIQQISKLGHEIGLHYDTNFLPNSDKKFEKLIEMEANLLGNLINKKITSIAQHNPTISKKRPRISNFLDANSADVIKEMTYISDSNQHWRRSCMCNHILKINKLQINTHPVWWRKKSKSRVKIYDEIVKQENKKIMYFMNDIKHLHKNYFNNL